MAKLLIILALSVVTAQSAVLRNNEAALKRVARSPCDSCDNEHHNHGPPPPPGPPPPVFYAPPPPGPPPPPPGFHAQQWTGYLSSADGSQQGVFSGAAASARDDTQASGQAYTLSGAGSGSDAQSSGNQHPVENAPHRGDISSGASAQAAALGQESQTNSFGAGHAHGVENQRRGGANNGYRTSSHGNQAASGANSGFGQSGFEGQQKAETNAFGAGNDDFGSKGNPGASSAKYDPSGQESQANAGANAVGYEQPGFEGQAKTGNSFESKNTGGYENHSDAGKKQFGSGQADDGFSSQANAGASAGYTGQSGGYGSNYNDGLTQTHESGQASLQGALGLAYQGLQAQQGVDSGCSTCGKSSYALSNAKTHSGNAIAVSVNG